eukprot:590378-Rhodomonas_salina.1
MSRIAVPVVSCPEAELVSRRRSSCQVTVACYLGIPSFSRRSRGTGSARFRRPRCSERRGRRLRGWSRTAEGICAAQATRAVNSQSNLSGMMTAR